MFDIKILINQPESQIQTYAMLSKYPILPLSQEAGNEDVAMVVDNGVTQDLIQAVKLNIPVAVITEKGSEFHNQALRYIPAPAVIYYYDGKMQSDQKIFSSDEGLTVQLLEEICLYIKENKIYPGVYIWKPRGNPRPIETNPVMAATEPIESSQKAAVKPAGKTHTPAQTDLINYINVAQRIIAVFKSTPDAQASVVAQAIARKLEAVYLGVGELQPSTVDCAYSDGTTVNYNSSFMPNQVLVVEVDIQVAQAMEVVYSKAAKIVHVCGSNVENGVESVKYWTQSNFRLDAVIPDKENLLQSYKSALPLAVSVDEFIRGGI